MNLLSELFALHKKRTPPAEATLKDTVHVKTSGSGETGCYVSMLWLGVQHHLHELEHGPQIGRQDGKAHTHWLHGWREKAKPSEQPAIMAH